MDGGGRILRSVSVAFGDQPLAAGPRLHAPVLPKPRRNRFFTSRASVSVPVEQRVPRGLGTALVLAFFSGVGIAGFILGGHGEAFRATYGEPRHAIARALGLGIDRVTITGLQELHEGEILAAADIDSKKSLVFLDVGEVRRRLEAVPLIREASVRKLYPDELAITLSERQPAALFQHDGNLFVVAADGTVIDQVTDERFAQLPFVVGDGANTRSAEYIALLEAAGTLRPRIRAGMLVAGRRWNLKLDNGVDVKLPELGAREALARFALLEREHRISEKDILSVDLRQPDRIVMRQSVEAAAARAETLKKKGKPGKGAEI